MTLDVHSLSEPLFYCPDLASAAQTATLDQDESRHVRGSRRLAVGDSIWLFDGQGMVGRATISTIARERRAVEVTLRARDVMPVPRPQVEFACALPRGERQAVLLDMATQLGMRAFRPFLCERSIVKPGRKAILRWRRICVEACKQSRRPYLPALHDPAPLLEVATRTTEAGCAVWCAHPDGVPLAGRDIGKIPDPLLLNSWSRGRVYRLRDIADRCQRGQTVSLGAAILRIETAAMALLACVALHAQL
jgi:16S rRNA (uracil1498-N3)-methyltransferase